MTPNRQNPFARKEEALSLASDSAQLTAADLNYDYSQLPDQHRLHVQSAAAQIKLQFKRAQNSILEIGKQLTAVKERLDHGQFGDWLHAEFSLTDRSAQRYMQAFATFGQRPDANMLTSSALMLLSGDSTPEPAREEAIRQAKQTGKSPTKSEVKEIIEKHKPIDTISEAATFSWLRNALELRSQSDAIVWLQSRPTADDAEYMLPPDRRFDKQVYKRVRSQLLEELRQPTQKPAVPRSTPPAPITPVPSTTPQIAPIASATPSDLRNAVESQPDVKSLINHYTESVSLLPLTKQAIKDPAYQWSYDRLQRDLRTLLQYLNQL